VDAKRFCESNLGQSQPVPDQLNSLWILHVYLRLTAISTTSTASLPEVSTTRAPRSSSPVRRMIRVANWVKKFPSKATGNDNSAPVGCSSSIDTPRTQVWEPSLNSGAFGGMP